MSAFAKGGNRVLFIENTGIRPPTLKDIPRIKKRVVNWLKSIRGFRSEAENLYVYSPLILPFPYSRIARLINKYLMLRALKCWMRIMQFDNPIVWTFLPTGIALDIIHSVNPRALVYYYIADFDRLTKNYKKLRKAEEKLMKECDAIFVQGEYFKERCLKFNRNVHIFPFGVNIKMFEKFKKEGSFDIPDDLKRIQHPIIGYIGGVHHHIDFVLIKEIATAQPQLSIVIVGPIQTSISQIKELKNLYLLGKKDFAQLPAYINRFDVCIVPYLLTSYTKTVYPTKLNEYHILGKPVVSTLLPEVIKSNQDNLVLVGKDAKDFIEKIRYALDNNSSELIEARIRAARNNDWDNRIEQMSGKIEEAIEKKEYDIPKNWQERFLGLYRISRKRFLRLSFAATLLWIIIFYTPLIWYLAEPLKLVQEPQNADAIVVFAGGVGESGQAGQGYDERVNYAVELYKKGYAKNLIFSTGARSTFPEPYIMKALAISLGIPKENILLEDMSSRTYENVKFTVEILDKRGWKKIILVSTPYHMLRSSLVFKKVAADKAVICSPIPFSKFYSRGADERGKELLRQINLSQIKAITHEYVGIFYYWLKGYI